MVRPLFVGIPSAVGDASAKILDRAGQEVAVVRAETFGQAVRDAKLFAAAPQLLASCNELLDYIRHLHYSGEAPPLPEKGGPGAIERALFAVSLAEP